MISLRRSHAGARPWGLIRLGDEKSADPSVAGGKAAALGRLLREGFSVPPGFVLPAGSLAPDMAEIPDRARRAIARACAELEGSMAVRSSMVAEDGARYSFAGQLATKLNVQGEEGVLESIRWCVSTASRRRARDYLRQRGGEVDLGAFEMAVLLQRMVPAQAAGVAFSADPATGERCVVIEAVHGLGDAVAGGLVSPARSIVDARGVLVEDRLPQGMDAPPLSPEAILDLAAIVNRIEALMGTPQDVEWAHDGERFWILQARAITNLTGKPIYSNKLLGDMSPGLVKPLLWSTNTLGMARNVFGRIFREILGPTDIDYGRLITRIHSRVYANVTLHREILRRAGLPPNLFEFLARDERASWRRPRFTPRLARSGVRLLRLVVRHSRAAREVEPFLARQDRELEEYRNADWTQRTLEQQIVAVDRLLALHARGQWAILVCGMNMMIRNRILVRICRRHAPDIAPTDLIRGLVDRRALEPQSELRRLSLLARKLPTHSLALLEAGDDAAVRAELSKIESGRNLLAATEEFIRRFGFLSVNAIDFTLPPWAENREWIWSSIGRLARHEAHCAPLPVEEIRARARESVRRRLGPIQRLRFDRLLRGTIEAIDLRERTSLILSADAYQTRRLFLAIGERLVARGDLDDRDGIFFLEIDELRRLVAGRLEGPPARARIAARRSEEEVDRALEPPETICGEWVPSDRTGRRDEEGDLLSGIGSSTGVRVGRARIVMDPMHAPNDLSDADILIVPFTDVGWTPLLAVVGGIVSEKGGQLSHSSIIAREYGLPAVVGVAQATRRIREGERIEIDGGRGRIRRLDAEKEAR